MADSPNECCRDMGNLVTPETEEHESAGPTPYIDEDEGTHGFSQVVECIECERQYKLYYEYTDAFDLQTEEEVVLDA